MILKRVKEIKIEDKHKLKLNKTNQTVKKRTKALCLISNSEFGLVFHLPHEVLTFYLAQ